MGINWQGSDKHRRLLCEQVLVRQHFPVFNCQILDCELICRGRLSPAPDATTYRVQINYSAWQPPSVQVIEPKVDFTPGAHLYKNGTLCLYDWRAQPWEKAWHLHQTVIPWTAEWLIFYELSLLTGKWLGKSAAHNGLPNVSDQKPDAPTE